VAESKKKPAAGKAASGKKTEKEKKTVVSHNQNQIYSVVLFAAAILILLLALVQGSAGWLVMHRALKGFFGLSLLMIPAALCYIAVMLDKDETPQKIATQALTVFLATAFLSGFLEILFGGGRLQGQQILPSLKLLYEEGMSWNGGGMLSALIAIPLLDLFGDIGSKIIICLLLFVSIMWLTKKSLTEFLAMLAKPFCALWRLLRADREDEALLHEMEEEYAENELRSEREALSIAAEGSGRKHKQTEPQFLIDVPMETPEAVPAPPAAAVTEPVTEEPTVQPTEQDAALEELIRKATEKPKKKTKEEQKLETVLEIADEIAQQAENEQSVMQYHMPTLDFLESGSSHADDPNAGQELREKADLLRDVLKSFNVEVRITNISRGPSVTRYEVQPAAGVKVSKITGLADDIALNFAAQGVRIEAPIPGKPAIGIEVPNSHKDIVSLRELLESHAFTESKSKLSFAVGRDIAGNAIIGDIAKMPHMIIAGATGSGKSVCTNSIIMSILYHATPAEVKLILVDPKIVEFRVYDGIPHLLIPVVTDPKKAAGALNWAVQEMTNRYNLFAEKGVRNLSDYNTLCASHPEMKPMSQIVICIDELADLMMTSSKEVEEAICRLAQLARAAGMHLIIATQRPTTDIITGLIKANIPSRIALSVMSQVDSRIILDTGGAEKLLGHGDMLYLPSGQPKPVRVQGCYVSTAEIERVVNFIKQQSQSEYDESIMDAVDRMAVSDDDKSAASGDDIVAGDDSDLLEQAIEVVVNAGQASTSNLQRRLRLGYARAARIMDELEEMGVIGPYEGAKPRRVLMTKMQLEERKLRNLK
jgi:S-DNA-T family DNA segregation ATPase FtsK/SpoIIIE